VLRKKRVQESHLAVEAYEAPMSTRPPAMLIRNCKSQVPVTIRGGRPYESQLGTCHTCIK